MRFANKMKIMDKIDPGNKKKLFRRIIQFVILGALVLLILNLMPAFFYKPEVNSMPLQKHYKKGVYHIHSIYSDGTGSLDKIASSASSLKLDFLIMTDHGRPNVGSSTSTGWKNNVLVIGGSELSVYGGHLASMGFKVPDYIFPPESQESIDEVIASGGVCFLAHPFDDKIPWTDWDVKNFTGMEIYSSYNEARRAGILKLLAFPLKYWIDSKYALLSTMGYPGDIVSQWDKLNSTGRYSGIYALDVHAKLKISNKIRFTFPTYGSMFEIMTVYVRVDDGLSKNATTAASQIVDSIRKGNFFNTIEAIAPANGFECFFMDDDTGKRVPMGGGCESDKGRLVMFLPFQFETDIVILRNGTVFKRMMKNNSKRIEIPVSERGVYRAEVFVGGNTFKHLIWILTNPFFVGSRSPLLTPVKTADQLDVLSLKKCLPDEGDEFMVEKNKASLGEFFYDNTDKEQRVNSFKFKLVKDGKNANDFWSALAIRKKLDFSTFRGFVLEVKSDKKRRFIIELRTGEGKSETWYMHTFLADPEWKRIIIPFDKMSTPNGERKRIDLSDVRSYFISINNSCAYEGTEGNLYFKYLGLY